VYLCLKFCEIIFEKYEILLVIVSKSIRKTFKTFRKNIIVNI